MIKTRQWYDVGDIYSNNKVISDATSKCTNAFHSNVHITNCNHLETVCT